MATFLAIIILQSLILSTNSLWDGEVVIRPREGISMSLRGLAVHPRQTEIMKLTLVFSTFTPKHIYTTCVNNTKQTLRSDQLFLSYVSEAQTFRDNLVDLFSGRNDLITSKLCGSLSILNCNSKVKNVLSLGKRNKGNKSSGANPQSPGHKDHSKQKRFIPLIAAGLGLSGLGLGIYNTLSSTSLYQAVSDLEDNQEKIKGFINSQSRITDQLIKVEKEIYIKMHDYSQKVNDVIKLMNCQLHQSAIDEDNIIAIRETHNKYERIIQSIFRGDLTDEMLKVMDVKKVLSEHEDWAGSIYINDISLFYLLAKIIPLTFHPESNSLDLMLVFPLLKYDDVAPLLSIDSFGFQKSIEQIKRLIVPSHISIFTVQDKTSVFGTDLSYCDMRNGIYICQEDALSRTSHSKCIENLILENVLLRSVCQYEYKKGKLVSIKRSDNNLAVIGYDSYIGFRKARDNWLDSEVVNINSSIWNLITFDIYETVQVDNQFFQPMRKADSKIVIIDSVITEHNKLDDFDLGVLTKEWQEEEKVMEKIKLLEEESGQKLYLNPLSHPSSQWLIIVLVLTMAVITTFWCCKKGICTKWSKTTKNKWSGSAPTLLLSRIDPTDAGQQRI